MDLVTLAKLKIMNRSKTGSHSATGGTFQISYTGTEADVYAVIGSIDYTEMDPHGIFPLVRAQPRQLDGLVFQLDLYYQGGIGGYLGSTSGPRYHDLNCRPIQLPLETASGYLLSWDHYVFQTEDSDPGMLTWLTTAKKWSDIPSGQLPTTRISKSIDLLNTLKPVDGVAWAVVNEPEKPGVRTRTAFVYEITEYNTHLKESDATWAAVHAGEIVAEPPLGDFGIVAELGGDWRSWGGTITQKDGKIDARTQYKHMPGTGWDADLVEAINGATE